jgi:hypothetical protein
VMEDWTYTPPQADTDDTPPAGKRKRRSYGQ